MDPKRILVVQLRRIGDCILTQPAVAALKRRFPSAKLDYLVEPGAAEAVRAMGLADEVLVYGGALTALAVRRRGYDLVVDLMGNPRTAILTALSGARRKAGPAHVFHRWAYDVLLPQSSEVFYAAREKVRMLAPLGVPDEPAALPSIWKPAGAPRNRVGFFPASRKVTRAWPGDKWIELGKLLRKEFGCEVEVFWGPGERTLAESVVKGLGDGAELSPATGSLAQLASELAKCRLVVTNCAGPKHVAVASGVPTLTIHSSSDPKAWTPHDHPDHRAVRRDELHCIGCMKNDCPYALECLTGLEAARVLEAAKRMLAPV